MTARLVAEMGNRSGITQVQQLINQHVHAALINQQVHAALISENESDIEALMDSPYRDEAIRRINALTNPPESQEDCNDLTEKLREDADNGSISKETFRIYAYVLNKLLKPNILNELVNVRLAVGSDPNTPAQTLTALAGDTDMFSDRTNHGANMSFLVSTHTIPF